MTIYVYRTKCLYCIIVQMKELFQLLLDMFLLKFSFPAAPSKSTAMGSVAVLYIVHLTFDTTLFCRELRERKLTFFLINICICSIVANLVFLFGVASVADDKLCYAIAIILHYCLLASWMWMTCNACVMANNIVTASKPVCSTLFRD